MLCESFIAASSAPPKLTSSQSQQLKDAGIFSHTYQPQSKLEQFFKKSASNANSIACTETHVLAAQAGKAAVHVYSRLKGNQEATIQFPEKICSLTTALNDSLIVLGGEGGGLHLWEIYTGRHVPTAQAHLQSVNALAVDSGDNFVLSGSEDTNIHVWSLLQMLSLQSNDAVGQGVTKTPHHTLCGHRGPITSIAVGHSRTNIDIAISASRDETAMVWNYKSGTHLRTILLPTTALCMTIDPGDRGVYAGLSDGTIQIIDFLAHSGTSSIYEASSTPIQPDSSTRISQSSTSPAGPVLALTLSYDSTTLLSGHTTGKILSWDVGRPAFSSQIADYPEAPITNLQFLPPTGFPNVKPASLRQNTIVKPRMNEAFSGPRGGRLTGTYTFAAHFPAALDDPSGCEGTSEFERALRSPLFPDEMLDQSISDLQHPPSTLSANDHKPNGDFDGSADFVALGSATKPTPAEEIAKLNEHVEHLQKLQKATFRQVDQLKKDKAELEKERDEDRARQDAKELAFQEEALKNWGKPRVNGAAT